MLTESLYSNALTDISNSNDLQELKIVWLLQAVLKIVANAQEQGKSRRKSAVPPVAG